MRILSNQFPTTPYGVPIPGVDVVTAYRPVNSDLSTPTGGELVLCPYGAVQGPPPLFAPPALALPSPPVVVEALCPVFQLSERMSNGDKVTGIRFCVHRYLAMMAIMPEGPYTTMDLQLIVINQLTGLPAGFTPIAALKFGQACVSYDVRGGDILTFAGWCPGADQPHAVLVEVTEI